MPVGIKRESDSRTDGTEANKVRPKRAMKNAKKIGTTFRKFVIMAYPPRLEKNARQRQYTIEPDGDQYHVMWRRKSTITTNGRMPLNIPISAEQTDKRNDEEYVACNQPQHYKMGQRCCSLAW